MSKTNKNSKGFTILELMVGMGIFLILSSAILSAMANLQKNYRNRELRTTMQQRMRGAMELMAQEIGQAGLQSSTVESNDEVTSAQTYSRYSLSSFTPTTAVVSPSVAGIYAGEWLQVDGGANQDPTQVTLVTPATNTITGNFTKSHAPNTVAYPMGVFPHGILAGATGDPSTGGDATHASKLAFYGEINGPNALNGNGLVAVEYSCPTPGSSNRTLTRTEWNALTGLQIGTSVLLDNVTSCYFCWPGSAASVCPASTAPDTVQLANGGTYYPMISQVGFTVTVQETDIVSGTNQLITITKSYSNIQPRNIIAADAIYKLACASATNSSSACNASSSTSSIFLTLISGELQPDPPLLSSIIW
jgi:prepilin-type N-terminal cleavage/methylation domain-containing protein